MNRKAKIQKKLMVCMAGLLIFHEPLTVRAEEASVCSCEEICTETAVNPECPVCSAQMENPVCSAQMENIAVCAGKLAEENLETEGSEKMSPGIGEPAEGDSESGRAAEGDSESGRAAEGASETESQGNGAPETGNDGLESEKPAEGDSESGKLTAGDSTSEELTAGDSNNGKPAAEESGTGELDEEKKENDPADEDRLLETPSAVSAAAEADMTAPLDAGSLDKTGGLIFDYPSQLPQEETVYTAGGGEIVWKPVLEGDQVVSGVLALKNAEIQGRMKMPVSVRVELEGANRIQIPSNDSAIGIYLPFLNGEPTDLTIAGPGALEISGGGYGIQIGGTVTIDGAELEITYGLSGSGASGIYTIQGDVVIQNNSRVRVKNNSGAGSSSGAIAAAQSGGGKVRIADSHVIAVNESGAAIQAVAGTIELLSSDVRAIGKTDAGAASGTLSFSRFSMDGGTLYGENKGSDYEIPLFPVSQNTVEMRNNAVLYGASASMVLPVQGDCVWYIGCTYEEASDKIITGSGYVYGNVIWNEQISLPAGKSLNIGTYSTKDTILTIPEGTVVNIPSGSKLNIKSSDYQAKGSLVNAGTLNVGSNAQLNNNGDSVFINEGELNLQAGGEASNNTSGVFINRGTWNIQSQAGMYNYYSKATGQGGLVQNEGNLKVASGGVFQNQSRLENSGTIDTEGNFSKILITGYAASVDNTGVINGFIIEMRDDTYVNVAHGKTAVKAGQTLTLGAAVSGTRGRILQIPDGAELTVEDGAVIDAKSHVTAETLMNYLDLTDSLVVNGLLLLPEQVSEETQAALLQKVSGSGAIQMGDTGLKHYVVSVNLGETVERQLVEENGQASLPADPTRAGYLFRGWYTPAADGGEEPFDLQTPIRQGIEITAKWTGINSWTNPLTVRDWIYGSAADEAKAEAKFGPVLYRYSDRPDGMFTEEVPVNAGVWYVKAAVNETEDYTGLESSIQSFRITPKPYAEGGDIIISQINSEQDVQNLVIKDGNTVLQRGQDYQVASAQDGSVVTVTITLMGNYTGTVSRSYSVSGGGNTGGDDNQPGGDTPGGGNTGAPGGENTGTPGGGNTDTSGGGDTGYQGSGDAGGQLLRAEGGSTGDSANVGDWVLTLLISGSALAALVTEGRKRYIN